MSLTKRLQAHGIKHHQAKDGAIYILQKVDTTSALLKSGNVPDILAAINASESGAAVPAPEGETPEQKAERERAARAKVMEDLMKGDPAKAVAAIQGGLEIRPNILRDGLVGEIGPDGVPVYFVHVDKPLHLLQEREVNVRYLPAELAEELAEEIRKIGRPAVEAAETATFHP